MQSFFPKSRCSRWVILKLDLSLFCLSFCQNHQNIFLVAKVRWQNQTPLVYLDTVYLLRILMTWTQHCPFYRRHSGNCYMYCHSLINSSAYHHLLKQPSWVHCSKLQCQFVCHLWTASFLTFQLRNWVYADPRSRRKPVSLSGPHKCNITTIQLQIQELFSCIAVVLHLCRPMQYNSAIQVFCNLQKTCRLLVAVVKNLYCSCIALVQTAL